MTYSEIIKQIMEDNHLTQQKLADALGVNQTTVSQWILGNKKPSFDNVLTIYDKFGVEPNELFCIKSN